MVYGMHALDLTHRVQGYLSWRYFSPAMWRESDREVCTSHSFTPTGSLIVPLQDRLDYLQGLQQAGPCLLLLLTSCLATELRTNGAITESGRIMALLTLLQ
jgi:hypothetical protein